MPARRELLLALIAAALAPWSAACDSSAGAGASDTIGAADTAIPEDTAADTTTRPQAFCDGATAALYDPVAGTDLTVFPDDCWTREADSFTGLRVDIDESTPWIAEQAAFLQPIFLQRGELDGFGTSAGVLLRFSAPLGDVPNGEAASLASDAVMLVALDGDTAVKVPFEAELVTTALKAADGGGLAPSPSTSSATPRPSTASRRWHRPSSTPATR